MSEGAFSGPPLSKIPRLIRNCRLSDAGDMLLMPEGVLRLKGTGADIVGLIDGNRTVSEMISVLCAKYSPSPGPTDLDEIRSDVLQFLDTLSEKRVIDFG